jgi:hypothetical protein
MTRARQRGQQPISVEALASGTANSETFLRGDGTWQVVDVDATSIQNGTSNVSIPTANANVVMSVDGVGNVFTIATTGIFTTGNIATSATGFLQVATGNTAQRPATPAIGMVRFNTDIDGLENFTDDGWKRLNIPIPVLTEVSGEITNGSASTLTLTGTDFGTEPGTVRFTSGATVANVTVTPASETSATVTVPSAIFNLSVGTVVAVQFVNAAGGPSNSINKTVVAQPEVDFLVVAGGGGGGDRHGGGGGAGGYRTGSATLALGTSYTVTVGAGGGGGNYEANNSFARGSGLRGSDSTFNTTTSNGGGGGATFDGYNDGTNRGSGGGGSGQGSGQTGQTGTAGQGNSGGNAGGTLPSGGGGGGAGGAGGNISGNNGGNGGPGSTWINGTTYAGGGGGAAGASTGAGGTGGSGGGGNGSWNAGNTPGAANTGGGGGGSRSNEEPSAGQNGGSGVVILRYPSSFTISNPGGGLTFSTSTSGSFKFTTFTAGTGVIQLA